MQVCSCDVKCPPILSYSAVTLDVISDTRRPVLKKTVFIAWASTLIMGLINKGLYGMFVACGIWRLADVSSVIPSSEQNGELWGNQCLNSWQ